MSVILFASLRCANTRHLWFRIACAVDWHGGVPDMSVTFHVQKVDLNGVYYDVRRDSRTEDFLENLQVIAKASYDGADYADTVTYEPSPWEGDTQSISMEINLPSAYAPGVQGIVESPRAGGAGR